MADRNLFKCIGLVLIFTGFAVACSHQGGKPDDQLARETDAQLKKQENIRSGTERLTRELSQIPANEALTNEPYRDPIGPYILERQETVEYKFHNKPLEDPITGEMPPANTLIAAVVEYKKVDDGPYTVPEKNITIPGYRLDGELTLVDHRIPAVIYRKTFKGASPKSTLANSNAIFIKEGAKEVLGEKPIREIEAWTRALPLRK